ncbi:hypothetical protein Nepgr_021754 [Nepenthes gracilis]|uniref:Uncharacterized protein n=1 Tax=Nepenthes gracilis TaxID=150966 RepID=A0AAD3SZ13_NEPGR|nr:hypothetical protein Nepgr_021754 [Nepenthes gracilis]
MRCRRSGGITKTDDTKGNLWAQASIQRVIMATQLGKSQQFRWKEVNQISVFDDSFGKALQSREKERSIHCIQQSKS